MQKEKNKSLTFACEYPAVALLLFYLLAGPLKNVYAGAPSEKQLQDLEQQAEQLEKEQAEARKNAEEEARKKAEAEAMKKAEEEARKKAEAEAMKKAEEEARKKEETEAQQRAAEEQKKQEAEAKRKLVGDLEMVDIPAGSFQMGCSPGDNDCIKFERPAHTVSVKAFRMGKYDVTVGLFRKFVDATHYQTDAEKNEGGKNGCVVEVAAGKWDFKSGNSWRNPGFTQEDQYPVVCVSWNDALAYVQWLSQTTGQHFRLPSEAEWEYAARGGTTTRYYWGQKATHEHMNYGTDKCCGGATGGRDQWLNTSPVGSFPPNPFGLYDMAGNVWQWTADCWNENYNGASGSGAAQTSGDCGQRVSRGGSWGTDPLFLRVSIRPGFNSQDRFYSLGFRLAQDI
jgi:formylglycine-generating enzyme required for sulfatase activity